MPKVTRSASYEIVTNDRREYAVWPSARPLPAGWRHSGKSGGRDELLAYLKSVCMDPVEVVPLPQPPVRK
jgi:MbtH protein